MRSRATPQQSSASRMSSLTATTVPKAFPTAQATRARAGSSASHPGPSPEWKVISGGTRASLPAAAQIAASAHDFRFAPLVWTWMR